MKKILMMATVCLMTVMTISIYHWVWRKPTLSVYTTTETKEREHPIVQEESKELSPATNCAFLIGSPYKATPANAELLYESGELSLFSGETSDDSAFNKLEEELESRNSLFMKRRRADGTEEWKLLLTTGSDWRTADGMDSWSYDRAKDMKNCFYIHKARFASDGRHLLMVCNPHTYTYTVVCSYDIYDRTFSVLIDGDTADEQPDGTILVKNKKTYLSDENGEPLGARWHDVWITPDGKIVREGKLLSADEVNVQ